MCYLSFQLNHLIESKTCPCLGLDWAVLNYFLNILCDPGFYDTNGTFCVQFSQCIFKYIGLNILLKQTLCSKTQFIIIYTYLLLKSIHSELNTFVEMLKFQEKYSLEKEEQLLKATFAHKS